MSPHGRLRLLAPGRGRAAPAEGRRRRSTLQGPLRLRRRGLVDGQDRRQGRHIPRQLCRRRRSPGRVIPRRRRRLRPPEARLRTARTEGSHRRRGLRQSLPRLLGGPRSRRQGGEARRRRGHQRDQEQRAPGGQEVLAPQPRQHRAADRRVPRRAQPVPRDGVREGRLPQPGAQRPQGEADRARRLGRSSRPGHVLPPSRRSHLVDTSRSQELQR